MKSPSTMRLLLVAALLLATTLPSTEAGKLKGLKGAAAAPRRNLKEKKADGKLPKNKVAGPSGRSCTQSAKGNEVKIECRTRSGGGLVAPKAAKGEEGVVPKGEDPKGVVEPKEAIAAKEAKEAGPETRTGEDPEKSTRGINLTPSELIRDEIKYTVKTSKQGIKVAIEYKQEEESTTSFNKTETEFELSFESLVEYTKGAQVQRWGLNNGVSTDAYNWDTDEIVQVIPLSKWDRIPGIVQDAEGVVSFFTASSRLEADAPGVAIGPSGTVFFNFTVSEANLNEHITANSMKIDLNILNFPWQRSDSYLALMSNVDSKKKVQLDHDAEALVSGGKAKLTEDVYVTFDEEMQNLGLEAFGAYTWENDAEATTADDNADIAVDRSGGSRRAQEEDAVVEDVSARPPPPPEAPVDGATPPGPPGVQPINIQHVQGSTTTIQVIATSPEEQGTENHQQIAYSFVGDGAHSAAEIYWDPEAGIGYGEAPISAALNFRSMSWVGSFAAALVYLVWS